MPQKRVSLSRKLRQRKRSWAESVISQSPLSPTMQWPLPKRSACSRRGPNFVPFPAPSRPPRFSHVTARLCPTALNEFSRQSAHRESLEAQVVSSNISSQKMGSAYAFIISIVAIAGGIWLIHDGKSVSGLTTILSDLVALAGVFVYSRKKQASERVEKSNALQERRQR